LEANQAVSFFIKLKNFRDQTIVQPLILENGKTQEKMVIKGTSHYLSISRYPMGTNEEEWEEEISKRINIYNRQILFHSFPD
jgi:hypothetical protein